MDSDQGPLTIRIERLVSNSADQLWRVDATPENWCVQAGHPHRIDYCDALVRHYRDNTELLIDRSRETAILRALSRNGFGVRVIGTFINGRIEKWPLGWRTLRQSEIRKYYISEAIAAQLARLHAMTLEGSHWISQSRPSLWSTIDKWFNVASAIKFDNRVEAARVRALKFSWIRDQITTLREDLESVESPVVFAHNNLLSKNILLKEYPFNPESWPEIQLTTFEYTEYNFRGFDIGNHFNEWAGFECNWTKFPTNNQQSAFIRNYLGINATEMEVSLVRLEAELYGLVSHLYWGLWAVIQASYGTRETDYLGYAQKRLDRLRELQVNKKELIGGDSIDHDSSSL